MHCHVYRCQKDRDVFVVTDDTHLDALGNHLCPNEGDELQKIGVFAEMGGGRVAFDDALAMP